MPDDSNELDHCDDENRQDAHGDAPERDAAEPDVLLDVPNLKVDEINLEVEDLRAKVSLQAEVLDLVKLNVGADVSLGRVALEITGVEAQALLKVRLDRVAAILERVLTTIDRNPQILENLTQGLGTAAQEVGEGAGKAVQEVGTGAGEAVEDVGQGAGEAVEDVGQGAGSVAGDVGRSAGEATEDVGQGARETVEDVGDTARRAPHEAKGMTEGATRSAREETGRAGERPSASEGEDRQRRERAARRKGRSS